MSINLIMIKLENKNDRVTSLELVDQINILREAVGKKSELKHRNLLATIRSEFPNCLKTGEVTLIPITRELPNGGYKNDPVYELNMTQAKQVLLRESAPIRKIVMNYLEATDMFNSIFKPIDVSGIMDNVINRVNELDDKLEKILDKSEAIVISSSSSLTDRS